MKKVTFSQEPIGDTIEIQGKLHVMYGKEEVTRVVEEGEDIIEYLAYIDPAISDNSKYITSRITKLEAALAKFKVAESLEKLTVTTANANEFDANLEARQNMADAILVSKSTGQTETVWRLADNTEHSVSVKELEEAHKLAIQKYAYIKSIGN